MQTLSRQNGSESDQPARQPTNEITMRRLIATITLSFNLLPIAAAMTGCDADTDTDVIFELDSTPTQNEGASFTPVGTSLPVAGSDRLPDPDRHLGDPCTASAVADGCECAQWGSWSGLQYEVCSEECAVDSDCPDSLYACIGGKCLQPCDPQETKCANPDAVCITPNGQDSICAHHN